MLVFGFEFENFGSYNIQFHRKNSTKFCNFKTISSISPESLKPVQVKACIGNFLKVAFLIGFRPKRQKPKRKQSSSCREEKRENVD